VSRKNFKAEGRQKGLKKGGGVGGGPSVSVEKKENFRVKSLAFEFLFSWSVIAKRIGCGSSRPSSPAFGNPNPRMPSTPLKSGLLFESFNLSRKPSI
jgi:hypothetical protein